MYIKKKKKKRILTNTLENLGTFYSCDKNHFIYK